MKSAKYWEVSPPNWHKMFNKGAQPPPPRTSNKGGLNTMSMVVSKITLNTEHFSINTAQSVQYCTPK